MAEELEVLWQKLRVTEEEERSVSLGRDCTKAAKERGKNCLVMKVLSRRGVMLDALRKNFRMLWKPNKSMGISVIGDEMFLVEFEDDRDKRRVLEMRPWHYEKQLVLLQEFDGKRDPKDIVLRWSPFWVQIYNLPLNHRTRETGMAIGASLGEVLEVDVADSGVQWGICLRVRVSLDVSRKLIRGKRILGEEGEDWWVRFKYERLPNFCYRCGLLEHDLKDCTQENGADANGNRGELQYGAWMRGEPARKGVWESSSPKRNERMSMRGSLPEESSQALRAQMSRKEVETDMGAPAVPCIGEKKMECTPLNKGDSDGSGENSQEMGRVFSNDVLSETNDGFAVNESVGNADKNPEVVVSEYGVTETSPGDVAKFQFEAVRNAEGPVVKMGLKEDKGVEGPFAMSYDMDHGWVAETLGPASGHWKRKLREGQPSRKPKELSPVKKKRNSPDDQTESDQNQRETKKQRTEIQGSLECEDEVLRDGGVAEAAMQLRRAK